jgi:hypothetical protein
MLSLPLFVWRHPHKQFSKKYQQESLHPRIYYIVSTMRPNDINRDPITRGVLIILSSLSLSNYQLLESLHPRIYYFVSTMRPNDINRDPITRGILATLTSLSLSNYQLLESLHPRVYYFVSTMRPNDINRDPITRGVLIILSSLSSIYLNFKPKPHEFPPSLRRLLPPYFLSTLAIQVHTSCACLPACTGECWSW